MKRIFCLLPLLILLTGCGEENIERAEALQSRYARLAGYETDVRVAIAREDETLIYTLHLTADTTCVRAEVLEPEELAGIGAEMTGETLALSYDGMLLDAISLSPRVSALSCAPMLLKNFPSAYLTSCGSDRFGEEEALRVDFSVTPEGETLSCALFFSQDGAPLYGEIASDGKIIAAVEFTNFVFGDILSHDENVGPG